MDSQKQQAAERIKQANNILVTVSSNPSVDQLAACIGLTLSLNKMGKHATAVFSGIVPSTIEFLQPEKTIEKNTDSLRDFIIALDKSKADKLRYKVEDRVVKIFITPYRTSINEKDLEFSQGDFNVDVIVALGVHSQAELDQAITSHGRILHDATVVTVNVKPGGELGGINWLDPNASSLSELALQLIDTLDKKLVDGQIATAFLTGIVAETERFSNSKTSPQTMSASAELMGAGANQQLVATKLEEPVAPPPPPAAGPIAHQDAPNEGEPEAVKKSDDGTLEIAHDETAKPSTEDTPPQEEHGAAEKPAEPAEKEPETTPAPEQNTQQPEPNPEEKKPELPQEEKPAEPEKPEEPAPAVQAPQIHIDEHGALQGLDAEAALLPPKSSEIPEISHHDEPPKMVIKPTVGLADDVPKLTLPDATVPGLPAEPPTIIKHPAPMPLQDDSAASKPPTSEADNELPSGSASGDSFLVGAQPTIIPPTPIAPMQPQSNDPPKIEERPTLAEPVNRESEAGKTLSDLEHEVHSNHIDTPASPSGPGATVMPSNTLPPLQPQPTAPSASPAPAGGNGPMFADDILSSLGIPSDSNSPAPAASPFGGGASLNAPTSPPMGVPAGGANDVPATSPIALPDNPVAAPAEEHPTLDSARDAVAQAIGDETPQVESVQALNAQPVDLPLPGMNPGVQPAPGGMDAMSLPPAAQPGPMLPDTNAGQVVAGPQMGMPDLTLPGMQMPQPIQNPNPDEPIDANSPPPVPPPMMPPTNPY